MLPSVVICNRGFSMKLSVAIQDDLIEAEVRKYTPEPSRGRKLTLVSICVFVRISRISVSISLQNRNPVPSN